MTRRARLWLFTPAVAGFGALLVWAVAGLPDFGSTERRYGYVINHVALPERHMTNAVTALVFDYRGFDTMGEEFILFAAVTGVVLLLRRHERTRGRGQSDSTQSDAIRVIGVLGVGLGVLAGLWLVAFGFVTPGGGFQGGVVLGGALLLLYAVGSYRDYHALTPHPVVEFFGSSGVGAFAVLGFVGLAVEGAFLRNFLGIGDTGTLFAGGSISFLNWATGIEVFTAMLLLFSEFLKTHMIPVRDWKP